MDAGGNLTPEEWQRTTGFLAGRRIPPELEHAIEGYIAKKTGKPYDDPVILERLRRAVVALKGDYWKAPAKRRLAYTKGYSVLGYLAYHVPVSFMQTEHLLATLAMAGLLKPAMTVLDAGTGPGVVPLAIADFFSRLDHASVTIHAIEQSEEHVGAYRYLVQESASGREHIRIHAPVQADIRTMTGREIFGPVDLLVFSSVVNEFEDLTVEAQADLVMKFAGRLAPDGTLLIVEPAEEVTATRLRVLSRALADRGLTIHSPCSFLFGTRCDPSRCWSFDTRPDIVPTRLMRALADCGEPYRYINTDIKFASVILRRDTRTGTRYRVPAGAKVARLSKLHLHVSRKITVMAAKMSQELGNRKSHMFRLCDGTAAKPVFAVMPAYHRTPSNEPLLSAPYGTILAFRNVLVRYNKRHDAYNLLVNRTTEVSSVPVS